MELTFYNKIGKPFCYTQDGEHLYTFAGQPIAYFHDDAVYAFNGQHLGWSRNGWIYDAAGRALLFSEGATGGPAKPGRIVKPGKAGKAALPPKGGRVGPPGKPASGGSWSTLSAEAFFKGG